MLAIAGFLMLFATGENGTLFFFVGLVLIISHFSIKGKLNAVYDNVREWLKNV